MIEIPDFLPLGSVVTLQGGDKPKTLMIAGRALTVELQPGERRYYDYALVPYPEGVIGDVLAYTNHDRIAEVLFRGFSNEEDAALAEIVRERIANATDLVRAEPEPLNEW